MTELRPGTRVIHAGLPEPEQGAPFLPGPAMASTFHLRGEPGEEPFYTRYFNPTWQAYERALGELDGGEVLVFASGMAAATAVLLALTGPGALVIPGDGYGAVRQVAREEVAPRGVEVREAPSETAAFVESTGGASLVWIETPTNPWLSVLDVTAIADAAHGAGALLAVDNTVATPLGQRPLELGADVVMTSGTKALTGHSDLMLGHVTARDRGLLERLRAIRTRTGGIAGVFEAWLAHRSLATLDLRLERACANALALAQLLTQREDVADVRYPGLRDHAGHELAARQMARFGPVVVFTLSSGERAQAFLAECELVYEATSFGGVHTTAERRIRWGDAVPEGFVRLSAGCEDATDLCADVARALDATL